jgi:NitT/TauT family transport system ATP-binding protein
MDPESGGSGMSFLLIRNLWKEYAGQVVLEKLNLHIREGEFCTLVGASGCGKSTFLRLLVGQESPSRGEIRLDGLLLPAEPGPDRGIVFQRYSVFPHLNVEENVILGLEFQQAPLFGRLFGRARRAAIEQAQQTLAAVGLIEARGKYPAELSGGMQQRLAIAQSLIMRPKILLLDEPFGALDPGIRGDMHELITKLWVQHGMTIFMVTHDLQEGFTLGTRLLVFDKLRRDPHAPQAYGATITYDIPLKHNGDQSLNHLRRELNVRETFAFV